jgi:hypothetical protein
MSDSLLILVTDTAHRLNQNRRPHNGIFTTFGNSQYRAVSTTQVENRAPARLPTPNRPKLKAGAPRVSCYIAAGATPLAAYEIREKFDLIRE